MVGICVRGVCVVHIGPVLDSRSGQLPALGAGYVVYFIKESCYSTIISDSA
jgi:hypothetical protein